jgi:NAD-dependent deacetylase
MLPRTSREISMNGHDASVLAQEWFREARSVVVLTNAGMSAEAAMPVSGNERTRPFARDLPAMFDSVFMYRTRGDEAWGWHLWRLAATRKVVPHAGHRALARLANATSGLTVITPNIDDLHERAGVPGVIHLRGNVFGAQCLGCGRSIADIDVPPDAADRPALPAPPPRCPDCGDVICPEIVRRDDSPWGEAWQQARDWVSQCDLLIVVGTTDVDYPQTGLVRLAGIHGAHVLEINPVRSKLSAQVDLIWQTTAGHGLSLLQAQAVR